MDYQSLTRAFQKTLLTFKFNEPKTYSEAFAQKRYAKKLEEPSTANLKLRRDQCWIDWLNRDAVLPTLPLLGTFSDSKWGLARYFLQKSLMRYHTHVVDFTTGSEFTPTYGKNSLEAKIARQFWDVTPEAFDDFAEICYDHLGLRKAVKCKFKSYAKRFKEPIGHIDHTLYMHFLHNSVDQRPGFHIFKWKLSRLVRLQKGSRFSTVPKNNQVERPINIEPFGNTLYQRSIGIFLRSEIQRIFGVDLDSLPAYHAERISDSDVATIDLSNASDSISLELVKRLLPDHLYKIIMRARSHMILGPDDCYYIPKKVSSMGNGFTFELMSLILLTLCRQYDPTATVFGDDIIIHKRYFNEVIRDLELVGLVVNKEKSFGTGPFRESCGANYHDDEGYIQSYDFIYPTNIHDCCVVYNKAKHLSTIYESFKPLERSLYRAIPKALRGPELTDSSVIKGKHNVPCNEELDTMFYCGGPSDQTISKQMRKVIRKQLKHLCYEGDFELFTAFRYVPELRSPTLSHLSSRHYGKYFMYLHAGRRTKDVLKDKGRWATCLHVRIGEVSFSLSSILCND